MTRLLFDTVVVQLGGGRYDVHSCLLGGVPRLVADVVKHPTTPHVVGRNEREAVPNGSLGAEPSHRLLMKGSSCRIEAMLESTRSKVEASEAVLERVLNRGAGISVSKQPIVN